MYHVGCALVHGQIMVRGQVVFMLVTAMKQLSKREFMMKLREEEKWQRILWRDTLIIMNAGLAINWYSEFSFQIFLFEAKSSCRFASNAYCACKYLYLQKFVHAHVHTYSLYIETGFMCLLCSFFN
ncbi:unnamed protein product, partial [Prunus brigantina]